MTARLFAWSLIATLVAVCAAFLIAGNASASPASAQPLVERLIAAQRIPGVRAAKEPTVDERELAEAIAASTGGNRTLAALALTMASAESGLRQRIADGQCKPHECDSHRGRDGSVTFLAVGLWQSHRLERGADLTSQATEAARELTRATKACHGLPFPLAAMRAYGSGRGCHGPIPRETERTELFARIRRALQ